MPNVDLTRIAGNIQALNSLNALQSINNQLAIHQARLASGKRLIEAADDPAGISIATTFDVRRNSLKTVLSSIGDAKNVLATAEGGMMKIKDILVKMKNKALEAQGDTIGDDEKQAIQDQIEAFRSEIDAIVDLTEWNGVSLIGSSGSAGGVSDDRNFLTDADGGTTTFSLGQGFGVSGSGSAGLDLGSIDVTSDVLDALSKIESAVDTVTAGIADVGSFTARLTFKEEALTVAHENTEAAYNRIMNANMAEEQVESSKLLILQQTSTAMLAQANLAPQFLLSLFQ
jgi:flagellin